MELFAYNVTFNRNDDVVKIQNITLVETDPDIEFPRANFNYFLIGITTIFAVLIGDGWNEIMYDHIRA